MVPNPNALYLQQSDFDGNGELRNTTQPTIIVANQKHLLTAGDLHYKGKKLLLYFKIIS